MGVSGILAGLVDRHKLKLWRLLFLLGTATGPILVMFLSKKNIEVTQVASLTTMMLSAFLIGLGTAIGSGCTSGHGICGLARLSVRSLIAVITFLFTAIASVYFFK